MLPIEFVSFFFVPVPLPLCTYLSSNILRTLFTDYGEEIRYKGLRVMSSKWLEDIKAWQLTRKVLGELKNA